MFERLPDVYDEKFCFGITRIWTFLEALKTFWAREGKKREKERRKDFTILALKKIGNWYY